MMTKIAYYTELDPFSGSVGQRRDALPALLRDLKLLLLLHDVVIVQPGNLVEHSLTLPAFEALAPFVRAGRLTTTVDPSSPRPMSLIEERIALTGAQDLTSTTSAARPHRPGPLALCRRREADELRARWSEVLPDAWPMSRNVAAQTSAFVDLVQAALVDAAQSSPTAAWALRALDEIRQRGRAPSRTDILAALSGQRGELPPYELAHIALMVQAAYFCLGAAAHQADAAAGPSAQCRVFPGPFGRILLENKDRLRWLPTPEFDRHGSFEAVHTAFRELDLSLPCLLGVDGEHLLEFAALPTWQRVRDALEQPVMAPSTIGMPDRCSPGDASQLRAILRDLAGRGTTLSVPLPRSAGMIVPAPWQLAAQAALGALPTLPSHPSCAVTLDLCTLELDGGAHFARVTRPQAHLLTVLAIAGDSGLRLEDLKQLTLDIDRLHSRAEGAASAWRPQRSERVHQDAARRIRVNVLMSRTNAVLGPFGLCIFASRGQGRWRLASIDGRQPPLRLLGSVWDLLEQPRRCEPPPGMRPTHRKLWTALADAMPSYVSLQHLASALGKPQDERGLKQTITTLEKLNVLLEASRCSFRVVRLRRGLYALLPKADAPELQTEELR